MACMCGDYCCPSCGPAQGNSTCPLCNEWISEGCPHFLESGDPNPTFKAEFELEEQRQKEADDAEAAHYAELNAMAKSGGWRNF